MITNERQLRISRKQLANFSQAIEEFDLNQAIKDTGHIAFARAQLDALKSEREVLNDEIEEYVALKSGAFNAFEARSLEELPKLIIKARIARGLSQRDLAQRLGVKEQQVQRYEADDYKSASLDRICAVANTLGLTIHEQARLLESESPGASSTEAEELPWQQFPVGEMYKRGWFGNFAGSIREAKGNVEELVREFLQNVWRQPAQAFHRQQIRSKGAPNRFALMAWQCRVLIQARRQEHKTKFQSRLITTRWLEQFVRLSVKPDWSKRVREHLGEVGIALVIERQLANTYLDGAALVLRGQSPVIGLTLRYDRLDNFWFVLLHELGHLVRHAKAGQSDVFFDDSDAEAESIEREADEFASEALIRSDVWETSIARYTRSPEAVRALADDLHIHPAIVAGRIRREADNYVILSDLIGSGEVRNQFPETSHGH